MSTAQDDVDAVSHEVLNQMPSNKATKRRKRPLVLLLVSKRFPPGGSL